jgi:hypothetical protein
VCVRTCSFKWKEDWKSKKGRVFLSCKFGDSLGGVGWGRVPGANKAGWIGYGSGDTRPGSKRYVGPSPADINHRLKGVTEKRQPRRIRALFVWGLLNSSVFFLAKQFELYNI